jgi:hypothetical protein
MVQNKGNFCITPYPPRQKAVSGKAFAAYQKTTLWDTTKSEQYGTKIENGILYLNVKFLNEPSNDFKITPLSDIPQEDLDKLAIEYANIDANGIPDAIRRIVAERYNPILGRLKFTFNQDDPAAIRIRFHNVGCWSHVGSDAINPNIHQNLQTSASMQFGWFDVGTVLHEFGHAIGLIHEHQNSIGQKNPLRFNMEKLRKYVRHTMGNNWSDSRIKRDITDTLDSTTLNGSTYDPNSIMLYFFPGSIMENKVGTPQNFKLSPTDVKVIESMYPTTGKRLNTVVDTQKNYTIRQSWQLEKHHLVLILAVVAVIIVLIVIVVTELHFLEPPLS